VPFACTARYATVNDYNSTPKTPDHWVRRAGMTVVTRLWYESSACNTSTHDSRQWN